jgi:hypothetical protein
MNWLKHFMNCRVEQTVVGCLFGTAAVADKMFIVLLVTGFIKLVRYERWSD